MLHTLYSQEMQWTYYLTDAEISTIENDKDGRCIKFYVITIIYEICIHYRGCGSHQRITMNTTTMIYWV